MLYTIQQGTGDVRRYDVAPLFYHVLELKTMGANGLIDLFSNQITRNYTGYLGRLTFESQPQCVALKYRHHHRGQFPATAPHHIQFQEICKSLGIYLFM